MSDLERTFFVLLEPELPEVAWLGEDNLRVLADSLAATAREAIEGVIRMSDCDVEMRRLMRRWGYPPELAKDAARRLVDAVA